MKISTLCVFSATLLLSSCAHLDGNHHSKYGDEKKDTTPVNSDLIDYGPSTVYEDIELEERELTPEIMSAVEVPGLATLIAIDNSGNAIVFDRTDELSNLDVKYPVQTPAILNAIGFTIISFVGSHCVDRIDTLGNARRICTPPHN